MKNIPTKAITIFLIVVVGIFSLNEYLYIHKHIYKDSSVVIHAHPYNKSKDADRNKSHQHATGDLAFLASLKTFLPNAIFKFITVVSSVKFVFIDKTLQFAPKFVYLFSQERAPPYFA